MIEPLSNSQQNDQNAHNEQDFSLRSRTRRIDLSELSHIVKLPKEEKIQKVSSEKIEPPKETKVPEEPVSLGHIPLQSIEKTEKVEAVREEIPQKVSREKAEVLVTKSTTPHPDIWEKRNEIRKKIYIALSAVQEKSVHPRVAPKLSRKKKKSSAILETLKFLATSAGVFVLAMGIMNGPAYWQILSSILHTEAAQELQKNLSEVVTDTPKFARAPLLPVAGIERQIVKKVPNFLNVTPLDNRLIIAKTGTNVPIVNVDTDGMKAMMAGEWAKLEKKIQDSLREGVVHYPNTAPPDQNGNFFITGHSSYYLWDSGRYKQVFALLGKLEVGDEYSVYWNQKKFTYKIIERKIVSAENTEVLAQPGDKRLSTLMTCWPIGTAAERLILVAEQQSEE